MAMLEFVLMLPFIWVVLVLTLDFGQAYLERQRAMVAVREMAIRSAAGVRGDVARDVALDMFEPRGMTGDFTVQDGGTCRGGDAFDESRMSEVSDDKSGWDVLVTAVSNAMGSASRTHVYGVAATGRQISGVLLPSPEYRGCFALDDGTWTHDEVGGYADMIANLAINAVNNLRKKLF